MICSFSPILSSKVLHIENRSARGVARFCRNVEVLGRGPVLQNDTAPSGLSFLVCNQCGSSGGLENVVDTLTRQARALEVFPRADFIFHVFASFSAHKFKTLLSLLFLGYGVIAKILLQANEDDGHTGTPFTGFFSPFVLYVFQGIRGLNRKADEDDMGFGVSEGAQTFVVFLASCIPERKLHAFAINPTVCYIILEYGWDLDVVSDHVG